MELEAAMTPRSLRQLGVLVSPASALGDTPCTLTRSVLDLGIPHRSADISKITETRQEISGGDAATNSELPAFDD